MLYKKLCLLVLFYKLSSCDIRPISNGKKMEITLTENLQMH